MNLPNKLTILRIFLVPIMVIIPYLNIQGEVLNIPISWLLINLIFITASITDSLDGKIARKNNQITAFGKFLDPIADKILVLAAMIMLVEMKKIPGWIPIIVLFREFIVSGYRLIVVEQNGNVIAASKWGKIKTVTQMIAIIMAFLDKYAIFEFLNTITRNTMSVYSIIFNFITSIIMLISVIATVFSGYDYLKAGKDFFKNSKIDISS